MKTLCVLLISTDPRLENGVRAAIARRRDTRLQVLSDTAIARARVAGGDVDIILAHLSPVSGSGLHCSDLRVFRAHSRASLIAVCPEGGETLGKEAVEEGADAYLLQQNVAELARIIDRMDIEGERPLAGRVVSVLGTKGGVGATTLALNTGTALAYDEKVVIGEFRSAVSTLQLHLHPERASLTPSHVGLEPENISSALIESRLWTLRQLKSLKVLFGSPDVDALCTQVGMPRRIVAELSRVAGVVVIDLGLSSRRANAEILSVSDLLTVVLERDPISVETAKRVLAALQEQDLIPACLIVAVVQRGAVPCPMTISEIESALNRPVSLVVPPASEICLAAQLAHLPAVLMSPQTLFAETFLSLARTIKSELRDLVDRTAKLGRRASIPRIGSR